MDERVGKIEEEIQILVTVHGRSEMVPLKKAREDLGAEGVEDILLEAIKWNRGGADVCALCGFDISEAREEARGRQWAQSFEIYDGVWVCGLCKDRVVDAHYS